MVFLSKEELTKFNNKIFNKIESLATDYTELGLGLGERCKYEKAREDLKIFTYTHLFVVSKEDHRSIVESVFETNETLEKHFAFLGSSKLPRDHQCANGHTMTFMPLFMKNDEQNRDMTCYVSCLNCPISFLRMVFKNDMPLRRFYGERDEKSALEWSRCVVNSFTESGAGIEVCIQPNKEMDDEIKKFRGELTRTEELTRAFAELFVNK